MCLGAWLLGRYGSSLATAPAAAALATAVVTAVTATDWVHA